MKNMYMTPLKYRNFNGVEKTTKLHFHITPREFMDWAIDNREAANELVATLSELPTDSGENFVDEATVDQKYAMLRMVRTLAELSYGKPDDDGEVFDHSGAAKFKYSAAYDAFRLFLFENPNEFNSFITTLLNEEVMKEFGERISALGDREDEAPAQQAPVAPAINGKRPQEMSREELEAAYVAKAHQS